MGGTVGYMAGQAVFIENRPNILIVTDLFGVRLTRPSYQAALDAGRAAGRNNVEDEVTRD